MPRKDRFESPLAEDLRRVLVALDRVYEVDFRRSARASAQEIAAAFVHSAEFRGDLAHLSDEKTEKMRQEIGRLMRAAEKFKAAGAGFLRAAEAPEELRMAKQVRELQRKGLIPKAREDSGPHSREP